MPTGWARRAELIGRARFRRVSSGVHKCTCLICALGFRPNTPAAAPKAAGGQPSASVVFVHPHRAGIEIWLIKKLFNIGGWWGGATAVPIPQRVGAAGPAVGLAHRVSDSASGSLWRVRVTLAGRPKTRVDKTPKRKTAKTPRGADRFDPHSGPSMPSVATHNNDGSAARPRNRRPPSDSVQRRAGGFVGGGHGCQNQAKAAVTVNPACFRALAGNQGTQDQAPAAAAKPDRGEMIQAIRRGGGAAGRAAATSAAHISTSGSQPQGARRRSSGRGPMRAGGPALDRRGRHISDAETRRRQSNLKNTAYFQSQWRHDGGHRGILQNETMCKRARQRQASRASTSNNQRLWRLEPAISNNQAAAAEPSRNRRDQGQNPPPSAFDQCPRRVEGRQFRVELGRSMK